MDLLDLWLMLVAGLSGLAGLVVLVGIVLSAPPGHWRSNRPAEPRVPARRHPLYGQRPDPARLLLLRQARWRALV
jgi:hypothetical protein